MIQNINEEVTYDQTKRNYVCPNYKPKGKQNLFCFMFANVILILLQEASDGKFGLEGDHAFSVTGTARVCKIKKIE